MSGRVETEAAGRRAVAVALAGRWPAERANGTVSLPFDLRYRRRIRLVADDGGAVLLDLDRAVPLRDGDGLRLAGGGWIAVQAAPEPVLVVQGDDAHHLTRLAWHLGNRHVPCEVQADRLLIRPDKVLAEMLRGLGALVTEAVAPFQPEAGAYARHDHQPGTPA